MTQEHRDRLIQIDPLWSVVVVLPTDYTDYGGDVERWKDSNKEYPDCSCECRWFRALHDEERGSFDTDWGVCSNPNSPRAGLLTWEHQHGLGCGYEYDPKAREEFERSVNSPENQAILASLRKKDK